MRRRQATVVEGMVTSRCGDEATPEELCEAQLCAICQAEYAPGDEIMALRCGHLLHAECGREWLLQYSKRCPTCKRSVLQDDDEP